MLMLAFIAQVLLFTAVFFGLFGLAVVQDNPVMGYILLLIAAGCVLWALLV